MRIGQMGSNAVKLKAAKQRLNKAEQHEVEQHRSNLAWIKSMLDKSGYGYYPPSPTYADYIAKGYRIGDIRGWENYLLANEPVGKKPIKAFVSGHNGREGGRIIR